MKKTFACILIVCMLLVGCKNNTNISMSNENVDYFAEKYVDEISLPLLDLHIDREFKADDRILILDDNIENELEYMIFDMYLNQTEGAYHKIYNNMAGGSLLNAMKNEELSFNEGIYLSKIFIDDIDILDRDDLDDIVSKEHVIQTLKNFNAEEFAIVAVEKEIKHNEKSMSMGPQTGDGEVKRYYLLAKIDGVYKIAEVYWADFLRD